MQYFDSRIFLDFMFFNHGSSLRFTSYLIKLYHKTYISIGESKQNAYEREKFHFIKSTRRKE